MTRPSTVVLGSLLVSVPLSWAVYGAQEKKSGEHATTGEVKHAIFTPDLLDWKSGPPSIPAGAKVAVLEGDSSKEGYFALRLQLPDGYKLPPHWHPNVERVTVISGTFHLGTGEKFEKDAAKALPAGSYVFMEPGMKHFAWAEGSTVIQFTTIGPWAINYVHPEDDPRQPKK